MSCAGSCGACGWMGLHCGGSCATRVCICCEMSACKAARASACWSAGRLRMPCMRATYVWSKALRAVEKARIAGVAFGGTSGTAGIGGRGGEPVALASWAPNCCWAWSAARCVLRQACHAANLTSRVDLRTEFAIEARSFCRLALAMRNDSIVGDALEGISTSVRIGSLGAGAAAEICAALCRKAAI